MTERLCHWPVVDPSASSPQDLSARGYPSEAYKHLYRRWGEGEIGIIVAGNVMLRYDAVEAFGNPILQDDHDGRVAAFAEVCKEAKKGGGSVYCATEPSGEAGRRGVEPEAG